MRHADIPSLLISLLVGIYGVGKAAVHAPALAILSHTPKGATKTIAWVGKGIVYDTGGLSIKDKVTMDRYCLFLSGVSWAFSFTCQA